MGTYEAYLAPSAAQPGDNRTMRPYRSTPILLATFVAVFLVACGEGATTSTPTATAPVQAPSNTITPDPAPTASADGAVKLNPAHGEPGHVCAIPVGAPLDGSAATSSTPETPTFVPPPAMLNPPADNAASGITLPSGTPNPAHGEPGHRCEVNVGDPLP